MEIALRAALIGWLASDPVLAASLNSVTEEVPLRAAIPWLALAASALVDWGCKDTRGGETRIALELHCRGDQPDAAADLVSAIQARVESLPRAQPCFAVAGVHFMRSRVESRADNVRAILIEYRFRTLAA